MRVTTATPARPPLSVWLTRKRLQFIRWRTVRLMEQIDTDTGSTLWFRDIEIPDLLTRLSQEKYALLDQLDQVTSELDALTPL